MSGQPAGRGRRGRKDGLCRLVRHPFQRLGGSLLTVYYRHVVRDNAFVRGGKLKQVKRGKL